MKPPYEITPAILNLISSISEKLGEVSSAHLHKPPAELRKKNRIATIQSSLEIEGNTLSIDQITALLNNKRVIGPEKDIIEVQNAINVYDQLNDLSSSSISSFCKAHKILMKGLVKRPGSFRTTEVGIVKGTKVAHIAPKGSMVKGLMNDLFKYLKSDEELVLIKSCVFHYELEFIHPFVDGNGRMGRLWQTLILMDRYPVFKFLPIETIIKERQAQYYTALGKSDRIGQSTIFIHFMLSVMEEVLERLLSTQNVVLTSSSRIQLYLEAVKDKEFTRQDYLRHFKEISPPTASRDLKLAVGSGLISKYGDKRTTIYKTKR